MLFYLPASKKKKNYEPTLETPFFLAYFPYFEKLE
jgi:hypothetical protein